MKESMREGLLFGIAVLVLSVAQPQYPLEFNDGDVSAVPIHEEDTEEYAIVATHNRNGEIETSQLVIVIVSKSRHELKCLIRPGGRE